MLYNCESYFSNSHCKYFVCHRNMDKDNFNCLFCFCPLFYLEDCGGSYIITSNGIKDCSNCNFPHFAENYVKVLKKIKIWGGGRVSLP